MRQTYVKSSPLHSALKCNIAIAKQKKKPVSRPVAGKGKEKRHRKTAKQRIKANTRFKKIENDKLLRKYVIKKLKKYWSPEQISAKIKNQLY